MAQEKYVGRFQKGNMRKRRGAKRRIALLCIVLILSLAVSGTLAYFIASTNQVKNQFVPASVTCRVNANNDGTVDVTNTGTINAYIRAAIVVNWMDENGNVRGIAPKPTEYSLSVNNVNWWQDTTTGFYYYKLPVVPQGVTEDLVEGIEQNVTAFGDYQLKVEVVAEAIQAEGDTDVGNVPAYKDAWGITSISGS